MTPQNKAWDLVQNYIPYQHYLENDAWGNAKKCALIAVNEVLKAHLFDEEENHYFIQVKQEIEKL